MTLSRGLEKACRLSVTRSSVIANRVHIGPTANTFRNLAATRPAFGTATLQQAQPQRDVSRQRRLLHVARPMQSASEASSNSDKATESTGDILCDITPAPEGGAGEVATITLSNPRRLNSLNSALIAKLTSTLKSLANKPELRCVVIQGELLPGKTPSFTSGANIFEMAALKNYDDAAGFISRLSEVCKAMRDIPVPTIAKVNGLCVGGGLELVAGCDFRYATRASTFSMPETKYGIPSVIEARLLANIIGWQKTKEMVYLAKFYDGAEMEKWGLVDECCEDAADLDRKVGEFVKLISSYGPQTMRAQKSLIKIWEETDLITGIKAGVDSYASMFKDGGSEPGHYMKLFTERKR